MTRPPEATLNQLRYFAKLAEELHFGRAAQQLGISQPALTRQIQSLEKFVGTSLVEQSRRAISLTAAGHAIGFEPCAPFHNLPSVVLQYLERYPQTRFSSFIMAASEQAEGLARRRIDL